MVWLPRTNYYAANHTRIDSGGSMAGKRTDPGRAPRWHDSQIPLRGICTVCNNGPNIPYDLQ